MAEIDFLRGVPIFAGLADAQLEVLAGGLRRRTYPKGALILSQGDHGRSLYIIETGSVRVHIVDESGREMTAAILSEGDVFGEMAVLDGELRSASVIALSKTEVLALHRDDFLDHLRAFPEIAIGVIGVLASRLRATTAHASELVFLDVHGRVALVLVRLAEQYGVSESDGIAIELQLTQSELATMVGATREMVNRALSALSDAELVRVDGRRLIILDPEGLGARIY